MGLVRKLLDKVIYEKVDNKPVALPVGFKKDPEADRLHHLMRTLVLDLEKKGVIPNQVESFEESLDFQLPDDEDGDLALAAHVSQSEMRYMQEESMLTEFQETSKMVSQRRDAANYRRKKYGSQDERRSGGSERRGNEDSSHGVGDAPQERGSAGKQAGK